MEEIATGPLDRDRDSFLKLLRAVQDDAVSDGHWKLLSISLAASHIDPLAVLESIYEPGERHAYIEHPQRGEALAGAEAVIEKCFEGSSRFTDARQFAAEVFANTVAVGQLELPLSGPHILCGFTFEEQQEPGAPFAAATLFIPRWQVSASEGAYVATANVLIEPSSDLEQLADKVLGAYDKFSRFGYTVRLHDSKTRIEPDAAGSDDYPAMVEDALAAIRNGEVDKVVLARHQTFTGEALLHPLQVLNRLRNHFPSCFAFSFGNGRGQTFLGATPERLLRLHDSMLQTEAIAGSAPRGATAGEDASLAAALLESDKDRREHAAVASFIRERLDSLGISASGDARTRLMKLPNVQHLVTPFSISVGEGLHLLDIAAVLHPTPAVGGLPSAGAISLLKRLERSPRNLYSGLVGWFDAQGQGELLVALRSGLVDGRSATLFAGAGIVAGSDPQAEAAETVVKMAALRDCLG